ncbi:MAG: CHASE3 domain-containing protein, partial [Thermodesulfovibrionales bacterium]
MYLRNKLTVFLLAFSLIIVSFILANLFIFERIDANVEVLDNISQEQRGFVPFKAALSDMEILTRGWLISGNDEFKRVFEQKRGRLTSAFGSFISVLGDGRPRMEIIRAFDGLDREIKMIFSASRPPDDDESVLASLGAFNSRVKELNSRIDA